MTPDLVFKEVHRFAEPEFTELATSVLGNPPPPDWLTAEEAEAVRRLRKNLAGAWALRIGAYAGERLIGWSHGWQDGADTFLMATAGVVPEHRRRGIYTALARQVLERTREEGFQAVRSRHVITNNPVLIAKLKIGFHLVGVELSVAHGTLALLEYTFNEGRRRQTRELSGLRAPLFGSVPE